LAQEALTQDQTEFEALKEAIRLQSEQIQAQERALAEQQRQLDLLRVQVQQASTPQLQQAVAGSQPVPETRDPWDLWQFAQEAPLEPVAPTPLPPQDLPPAEPGAPEPTPGVSEEPLGVEAERPKAEKPQEDLLISSGSILLPPGTLQIEPSLDYAHASADRVNIAGFTIFEAIVIGTIRVDRLDRDIFTGAVTTRYGIADRIQAEVRVPGVYREDKEVLGVGTASERERSISGLGVGDITAGLSYQAWIGDGFWPDVIVKGNVTLPTGESAFEIETESIGPGGQNRLVDSPTGSGFFGVGPEVTMVWASDPVVFFVGTGYTFNLERDFTDEGFGKINPGDAFSFFTGMNVALSERVAMNLSFVDQVTANSTQGDGDVEIPGSDANDGRIILGTSIALSPMTSLLVSAGAGLTEQSPDFQVSVSVPMRFSFF
jgi:hypothetical protein